VKGARDDDMVKRLSMVVSVMLVEEYANSGIIGPTTRLTVPVSLILWDEFAFLLLMLLFLSV
jgi:hypothetical protein